MVFTSTTDSDVYHVMQVMKHRLPIRHTMLFDTDDKKEHIYLMSVSQVNHIPIVIISLSLSLSIRELYPGDKLFSNNIY